MNMRVFPAILSTLFLASLLVGPAPSAKAGTDPETALSLPNPAAQPWRFGWVDDATSSNVGAYPSVVFSPEPIKAWFVTPYISYYDAINGHLMLAEPPRFEANCGELARYKWGWYCRAMDGNGTGDPGPSSDNVGTYSSIDYFYTPPDNHKVGIAYHDITTHALKYIEGVYSGGYWGWVFHTIASTNLAGADVGLYNSLKFDDSGVPHIAYYSSLNTLGSVKVATWLEGATGGNCGEGSYLNMWQCDQIDSAAGAGQYASLDLNFMDRISLAYYDPANGNLKYAYYTGVNNGSCGFLSRYFCETVDDSAADVGRSAVTTARRFANDTTRIAYYDRTNGKLKYAFQTTTGGNCGGGNWWCGNVDTVGAGLDRLGLSMAVDQQGYPIIAYQYAPSAQGVSKLKIARPAIALGLNWGNCGDSLPGDLYQYWQCTILDSAAWGQGMVNVADYTAVAIAPGGLATVVYRVVDDAEHTVSLKYATQMFQTLLPLLKK